MMEEGFVQDLGGAPRKFKTGKEFKDAFAKYLEYCAEKDKLPNIAGFCAKVKIGKTTYQNQKQYYPKEFDEVENMLEDAAINAKIGDSFKMFYMANKFGYRNKKDVDQTISNKDNNPLNVNLTSLTVEQIRELLNEQSED